MHHETKGQIILKIFERPMPNMIESCAVLIFDLPLLSGHLLSLYFFAN